MPFTEMVTLEGYIVRRVTAKAIGLVKEGAGFQAEVLWVPRILCQNGDDLEVDDTDLTVYGWKAEELGLDF